ncbi:MAG: SDR family oxidoreductase, partial [Deltaproteobacteria bacterium]|nr:SDR family oxidoreductase [Deltaproteobacteria bacterium]
EGKVALIAGGGQGIGEGIARCVAEEGADVAIADINTDNAEAVAGRAKAMGRKALAISVDLTDDSEVQKTVQGTADFFGKIDILINNVGGVSEETGKIMADYYASLKDATLPTYMRYNSELWDRFYQLNLKTHVMLSNAVTPHLIKQRSGSIVNISSIAGRNPDPDQMPYAAFKAGDISITWSLARALAPYNVRVNCICPGFVYTPLWERGAIAMLDFVRDAISKGQELPPRYRFFRERNIDVEDLSPNEFWLNYIVKPITPLGRDQTAEDMGRAAVFLVSEDAKNITGQVLHVDGGMTMR